MSTTTPNQTPEERAGNESLGQLLTGVTRDLSRLFRQEVELAKAELRDSATKAGRGAGLLGGAGVAGHFAVLFLSIALWWALGTVIGFGWSAVIVAIIYAIAAAILAVMGRNQIKAVRGMPQTADTVRRIPDALTPEERK
jgi:hypothetical protein